MFKSNIPEHDIYDLYFKGCYTYMSDFWDDVFDYGTKDFTETRKFKRTALYSVFKDKVKLLGEFELDVALDYLLDGNKKGLEGIGKGLEVRLQKERLVKARDVMNEKFNNLVFSLKEVN